MPHEQVSRELFSRLVDDAALFPPGNAPMPAALAQHGTLAGQWYAFVVGPFLCPASRLDEMCDLLDEEATLDLGLVVNTGTGGIQPAVDRVEADPRLRLRWLEVPLGASTGLADVARRTAAGVLASGVDLAYVEVPREPTMPAALDVLAEYDLRAKLRTGGADASAVPSEREVAEFIAACLDRELAFKLTAGLHHPVRHTDEATAMEQHGFLNALLAVDASLRGGTLDEVAAVLAERDADVVTSRVADLDDQRVSSLRRWFASYGSCSLSEPVDDLVALGLLNPHTPIKEEHE